MSNSPVKLAIAMVCFAFVPLGRADEQFEGRVTVNGKLEARQMEVAGRPVVTVPMLEEMKKTMQASIIEELTRQLRTNTNSYITKEFSDQVAARVVDSIGRSRTETSSLSKHLDLDVKEIDVRLRESERIIAQLKTVLAEKDREMNAMKRDIDELKREMSRRK